MHTNGQGSGVEIQISPENRRVAEPCPSSIGGPTIDSIRKSGFIRVNPWFNYIAPF